ncbi:MAG TPA: hypothetical protein VGL23_05910 [Chloroflexota bacterium]
MPTTNDPVRSARREIGHYLRAQTAPLQRAIEAQRQCFSTLPALHSQASEGQNAATAARARALGKTYAPVFRDCLAQTEKLQAPRSAIRCQEYMARWLNALINAADSLVNAPEDGRDVAYLRDCHDFLDDARYAVKPLTEIRLRLYEAAKGPPKH